MDCTKLAALVLVTAQVAKLGMCSERLLQQLLGLWAFAFQFRRPMFALFSVVYHVGHPEGLQDAPFRMPRLLQQELLLTAALGMLASTALKTQVCSHIFGTDASPNGAGLISCRVGRSVAAELFRRADKRGFHTRLLSPIGAYLHASGHCVEEPEFLLKEAHRPSSPPPTLCARAPSLAARAPESLRLRAELATLFERFVAACLRSSSFSIQSFRLDFVELYSGSAKLSKTMVDQGFQVGPPIEFKEGWDLSSLDLFEFLVSLCKAGRIALLWAGPPRTTFSLARRPPLRSSTEPWGFNILDHQTLIGNFHLHLCLCLFVIQAMQGGEAFVETPWGAYSRKLPWWVLLASLFCEIRLDQCRFGTPFLKPTGLLCTSRQYAALGRRCMCKGRHQRLEGAMSTKAAAYPPQLCVEFARISVELANTRMPSETPGDPCMAERPRKHEHGLGDHRISQRFVSHLWSTHLAEALPWKVIRAYRFKRPNHINVLESHAHMTLMRVAPMDCRLVVCQDSMVTLGANAKGRSSSLALNNIMRRSLAYQLAKNLYPVGVHCPTWALRADDPSRSRVIRPPRSLVPAWFFALRRGNLAEAQDELDRASDTARSLGRWLLFASAALLASSGNYRTVGAWAKTSQCPTEPSRAREGRSDAENSCPQTRPAPAVSTMVGGTESRGDASCRAGCSAAHPAITPAGGIRQAPLRVRRDKTDLCRNHQLRSPEIPLPARHDGRTVATFDNLGDTLAWQSASADAPAIVEKFGLDLPGLELAALRGAPLDRLLRLVEALRVLGPQGVRLPDCCRHRMLRGILHKAHAGQVANTRSPHAECAVGCSVCGAVSTKTLCSNGAIRKDLVLLHFPFPHQFAEDSPRSRKARLSSRSKLS